MRKKIRATDEAGYKVAKSVLSINEIPIILENEGWLFIVVDQELPGYVLETIHTARCSVVDDVQYGV